MPIADAHQWQHNRGLNICMHICFMSTASQNNLPEMAMTLWPPYKYRVKTQHPFYGYNSNPKQRTLLWTNEWSCTQSATVTQGRCGLKGGTFLEKKENEFNYLSTKLCSCILHTHTQNITQGAKYNLSVIAQQYTQNVCQLVSTKSKYFFMCLKYKNYVKTSDSFGKAKRKTLSLL